MAGFSTDSVANAFLKKAAESSRPVTPMKLQKLIYFAHGWHLALSSAGLPLVCTEPQAWDYGPVFPDVYHEFKDFGSRSISRMACDMVASHGDGVQLIEPSMDSEAKDMALDYPFAEAIVKRIWEVYGQYSAAALSDLTHEKGSPWWTVRAEAMRRFANQIPQGLRIPNELIRNWFKMRFPRPAASTAQ